MKTTAYLLVENLQTVTMKVATTSSVIGEHPYIYFHIVITILQGGHFYVALYMR